MRSKSFRLISILSLTLFIGALIFSSKRQINIKKWPTFTSTVYNYSLQFPNGWQTYGFGWDPQDQPSPNGQEGFQERHFRKLEKNSGEVLVKVWSSYLFADEKQAVEEEIESTSYTNKIISDIIINGSRGTKMTGDSPSDTTASYSTEKRLILWLSEMTGVGDTPENQKKVTVVFSKGNYIYVVQSEGVNIKIFEAILSTFKFLE